MFTPTLSPPPPHQHIHHHHHHHHINISTTTTTTTTPHRHATNESQWLIGRFSTHHRCQQVFMTRWWVFLASPPPTSPTTTTNKSSGLVGGFIWSLHPRQPTTAFSVDHNTHHGHHRVVETRWVFLVSPSTTPPTTATNESLWLIGKLFWPLHPHHPPPPPTSHWDSLVGLSGLSTPGSPPLPSPLTTTPTMATIKLLRLGGFFRSLHHPRYPPLPPMSFDDTLVVNNEWPTQLNNGEQRKDKWEMGGSRCDASQAPGIFLFFILYILLTIIYSKLCVCQWMPTPPPMPIKH